MPPGELPAWKQDLLDRVERASYVLQITEDAAALSVSNAKKELLAAMVAAERAGAPAGRVAKASGWSRNYAWQVLKELKEEADNGKGETDG